MDISTTSLSTSNGNNNNDISNHSNTNSNVSSPQQSATSSITDSPESFESSMIPNQAQPEHTDNENIDNIDNIDDIDIDSLCNYDKEQKRNIIINKLYNLIKASEPYLVAKITGMIIHKQSSDKLIKLLENKKLLHNKISEASDILIKTNYGLLYNYMKQYCHSAEDKLTYLRNKLYPKVEAYVSQKNLADIITDMLIQLNISEIFVLLNEKETMKKRMNEAIKAYLEANAVHIHAINELKNQ